MRRTAAGGLSLLTALSTIALSTLALAASASADPSPSASSTGQTHRNTHVCAATSAGVAGCHAIRHDTVDAHGQVVAHASPDATSAPSGYGPSALQSAYGLGSGGAGRTVAIVDAYDDPSAEADLATYRSQYGLPACTSASGCFTKTGQASAALPKASASWSQEISLDLDVVSAACPACRILLVEASSAAFSDLGAGVDRAAALGATAVSNSYGGPDTDAAATAKHYNHPGIAITASTGDAGYGVESPASLPTVVAVGGTSLTKASGTTRGWSESAWSGAGSGCSTLNAKPTWQSSATQCPGKANADVSAVADPNTGVAVYDSYAYQGTKGWLVFGGTSASSPLVASAYAEGTASTGSYPAQYTWAHSSALNDVTSGSNGTCATAVWCTATTGWDGPTGLGTPSGTSAF